MSFVHLNTHSEYSMLRSSLRISKMIDKAVEYGHSALALTDHGNMFGVLEFYFKSIKAGIKPIIGIELDVLTSNQEKATPDRLVLLCETQLGYENLVKIASWNYEKDPERFHVPAQVPLSFIEEYKEGLICLYGGMRSRFAMLLQQERTALATEELLRIHEVFASGDPDRPCFYLNLQDHNRKFESTLNDHLCQLAKQKGFPLVATNWTHYLNREDAGAFKVLRCVAAAEKLKTAKDTEFSSDQFHLRSENEMRSLFAEWPESIENTQRIADRCHVEIKTGVGDKYWPKYEFPSGFDNSDDFLAHMTWEKIGERYSKITDEIKERVQLELDIMKEMKVSGYMLIVQDFINWARDNDIPVGPGRGSAVGSIVSYIIGITDVDPLRFGLLFERFLNPERVSMPDIDTDFSDLDRGRVIDFVTEKYGRECVSQIVTYGRLKAKAVIRDVARVLDFEQSDVNALAKLIPGDAKNLQVAWDTVPELSEAINSKETNKELWRYAQSLEGLIRQPGMHAAAVIIAPQPLSDLAPLFRAEKFGNNVIQYDKTYAEDIGLLKMDFLGLRNLSVIKESLKMIKINHGIEIDPLTIDLSDAATYELLGKGLTVGVFQFESRGMQEYLRKLKPTCLEDMIAMNALYRPGPLENIPRYIECKNGKRDVECYHEDFEEILGETYGVIVYQEQVMLLAQKLSGFSLGGADLLRRAMAKKNPDKMAQLQPKFVEGAVERGYDKKLAERIWEDLLPFCAYAFNKSHSAAYAFVGYQTAYLKAHFGPEFMAANMTSEIDQTERLVILMQECRKLGIEILHPDVNSSMATFTAIEGKICYGLAGIKNVGLSIIEDMVLEREENGEFQSVFDLCDRVFRRQAEIEKDILEREGRQTKRSPLNKRTLESLVMAGALDHLPASGNRASLYASVDTALEYASRAQKDRNSGQISLFDMGGAQEDSDISREPELEQVEPWSHLDMLNKEKQVLGLYISSHPLEEYQMELRGFAHSSLSPENISNLPLNKPLVLGGIVTSFRNIPTKKNPNKIIGIATIEDSLGEMEIFLKPDVLEKVRDKINVDSIILAKGSMNRPKFREDAPPSFEVENVIPMEEARSKWGRYIHIELKCEGLVEQALLDIQESSEVFTAAPEQACSLVFHVRTASGHRHTLLSRKYAVTTESDFLAELQDIAGEENVWVSESI